MQRTVRDWLSLLERRHPTDIELGLERIRQVAKPLGIDPGSARVITVAGTNGKGSTCAMIDALLSQQGLRTGRYASPHLLQFHERITITGQAITDAQLLASFEAVEAARGEVSLTFFEFTTLAAFWSFQQAGLDVWVVEVGLGGRLDATNILDADLSVVTSIALDHQDWLGSDVVQIGREKAGIFRARGLAVLGQATGCEGVIEVADQLGVQLLRRNRDFFVSEQDGRWTWKGKVPNRDGLLKAHQVTDIPLPVLPLVNAATALQAVLLLYPELPQSVIERAFQSVTLQGRMQSIYYQETHCIVDVGHNPQAASYLVDQLSQRGWKPDAIILGMLADKDIKQTASQLLELGPETLYLASLRVPRGITSLQMQSMIDTPIRMQCCDSVLQAIEEARKRYKKLLICGSFYTAADAILHLQEVN